MLRCIENIFLFNIDQMTKMSVEVTNVLLLTSRSVLLVEQVDCSRPPKHTW